MPMKGIRGFYLLNASLRRLGFKEVPEFPKPSWMHTIEAINAKDADHSIRLVEQHRDTVEPYEHVDSSSRIYRGYWIGFP